MNKQWNYKQRLVSFRTSVFCVVSAKCATKTYSRKEIYRKQILFENEILLHGMECSEAKNETSKISIHCLKTQITQVISISGRTKEPNRITLFTQFQLFPLFSFRFHPFTLFTHKCVNHSHLAQYKHIYTLHLTLCI